MIRAKQAGAFAREALGESAYWPIQVRKRGGFGIISWLRQALIRDVRAGP